MIPTAANDNVGPDTPIRLADIVPIAFPCGGMTLSGLRREKSRGRLTVMRIAGKDFTTLGYVEEMKRKCLVAANQPAYGSARPAKTAPPFGSSSTEESNIALDAANLIVKRLRQR